MTEQTPAAESKAAMKEEWQKLIVEKLEAGADVGLICETMMDVAMLNAEAAWGSAAVAAQLVVAAQFFIGRCPTKEEIAAAMKH